MKSVSTPICYYPAKAIVVDDDADTVKSVIQNVRTIMPCKGFTNPIAAIDFIKKHSGNFVDRLKNTSGSNYSCDYDCKKLFTDVGDINRYDDIGVIIIDHMMPQMMGIDFCEQLAYSPIPKIMLTAEADERVAIDAFNQGLIDAYIKKSESNVLELMIHHIQILQMRYFAELSRPILQSMNKDVDMLSTCFDRTSFNTVICQILEQTKMTEYYWTDSPANFLLLDYKGRSKWLYIRSAEDIQSDAEFARQCASEIFGSDSAATLFEMVDSNKAVVLAHALDEDSTDIEQWRRYIIPCEAIDCKGQSYYYALTDQPCADEQLPSIKSFWNYREAQEVDVE